MKTKLLLVFFMSLVLIGASGIPGCQTPEELEAIDDMLGMISMMSMVNNVPEDRAFDQDMGEVLSVDSLAALSLKDSEVVSGALKAFGIESLEAVEPSMTINISGTDSSGWAKIEVEASGDVFGDGSSDTIDLTAKGRIVLNDSPITAVGLFTNDIMDEEKMDAAGTAIMDEITPQVETALENLTKAEVGVDVKLKTNHPDLKKLDMNASVTANLANDFVTAVSIIFGLSGTTTVDGIGVKFDLDTTLNASVEAQAVTGTIDFTYASGFLYMDVYTLSADFASDGTMSGTITHGAAVVEFDIAEDGSGTYEYNGQTYEITPAVENM